MGWSEGGSGTALFAAVLSGCGEGYGGGELVGEGGSGGERVEVAGVG